MNKSNLKAPQPVDAIIKISISNNKLEAVLNIEPPKNDGKGPNIQDIRTSLNNMGITYGINDTLLRDICDKPVYNKDIIIARGTEPTSGKDATYEILFKTEKDFRPKEKEDGTVDFHNLEIVENIKKNQVLCTITPATEGIDGISITGEKIPSVPGKPIPNLLGKNTKLNEDETAILSTIDGQVDFIARKIHVNETLFIKGNVDISTGNIKAIGNIIIKGSVSPGFVVEAKGNIEVDGTISSATLKAGGNIILRRGVVGSKLHCEGDFTSKFIENSNVFVKGDIKAAYIMNSNIKCGKTLQTMGSKSKIVGGTCIAGENIQTRFIGSSAAVRTFLEIGTDSNNIEKQQKLLKEIPLLENKLNSLKSLISLLQQYDTANRLTPDKKRMYEDALYSYKEVNSLLINGKQELQQIDESVKAKGYGRIICTDTVFPGTSIKIGPFQMKVRDSMQRKSFYYTDNGINVGTA
ncbi:FapA family protein [Tissierella sp. Yu-01]|uniref:DUF342 domain-containing protein n=1 Tax=Tissierella sp. Yu-01 TaxID=3035694 RepID=UPI00240DB60D|nr:FapA family protein [Tissierella sp. Yu-01]WFA08418.1 FapA family protein [Tissierella sp. Yu-01]